MAALMLVCSLAEQPTMTISVYRANNSGPLVATLLSNQSAAPYFTSGSDRGRNRLAGSFEWTNRSASYSILRSLSSSGGDLNQ